MLTQVDLDVIQNEAERLTSTIIQEFWEQFYSRPTQVIYGPRQQQFDPSAQFGPQSQEGQGGAEFGETFGPFV